MTTGAIQKAEPLTPAEKQLLWVMGQIEKRGARLEKLLHPDMPRERFEESCRLAFAKNPDLTDLNKTDGASLMQAILLGARSGLDVHGHYGHLVSFNNTKEGKKSIAYMADFKGLIATAKASGVIIDAEGVLVHEKDEFHVTGGANGQIHHVPFIRRKATDVKGAIIAAYTRLLLPSGQWVCKGLMLLEDIERIEGGIKAKNGPWGGPHRGEMIRKSSFRQAWKWLGPTTSDRAMALRIQALEEAEIIETTGEIVTPPPEAPQTGVGRAKAAAQKALEAKTAGTVAAEVASSGEPDDAEKAAILAQEKAMAEPGSEG